ncbi:ring-cleaving dioxygenase [Spirochaeta africana]|uniref:Lactoylglutathione lyase-like lyase n=1 Tax=Spirochaeta africana (strain ATCC 700263 / DSM 8902 / Z-7692) TaxID=889378 RepID=H9UK67_SPIAZ|nr:ring-cleaving dioxygenase [Spirochaeta africana]AFG37910.1 lactoylglutathione lyase-like lyase [Spirochaeta africana DSM 8902]
MQNVTGMHHITAISGDPQENLAFYQGVLGMRLVKRSINQDAPDTYHLFFADHQGNPGTDITFFPWPQMGPAQHGAGNWGEVSLTVPPGSIPYWQERLTRFGIKTGEPHARFGEMVLPFSDPHGMQLSLLEAELYSGFGYTPWENSPVPAEYQIRGLGGVRLTVRASDATARFFHDAMGFSATRQEGGWQRFTIGEGASGQRFDVLVDPTAPRAKWGVGAVHHVAWRATDPDQLEQVRLAISAAGGRPTDHIDRFWFVSVYVREPGGALCEIATDGPGFGVDENMENLGEALVLPSWYEPHRAEIEAGLPALQDIDPGQYR